MGTGFFVDNFFVGYYSFFSFFGNLNSIFSVMSDINRFEISSYLLLQSFIFSILLLFVGLGFAFGSFFTSSVRSYLLLFLIGTGLILGPIGGFLRLPLWANFLIAVSLAVIVEAVFIVWWGVVLDFGYALSLWFFYFFGAWMISAGCSLKRFW